MTPKEIENKPFRKRLQVLGHLLAGVVILIPAFEKFQRGETSYWLFLISGLLFISIAIFHAPISRRYKKADALFFAIEAILMGVMAFDYYYEGKSGLPIAYCFGTLGYGWATWKKAAGEAKSKLK